MGEVGNVSRRVVVVEGEVDEAEIKNKLSNLEDGDPFFPGHFDTAGCLEVVPVPDGQDMVSYFILRLWERRKHVGMKIF